MEAYRRTAQYYETDQMGVIHHANYVLWMEEARVAFMKELGCGYDEIERRGVVVPVIGVSVEYKKPVRFAETVEVNVRVVRYSGKILELGYTMHNLTTGMLCTRATSRHCFLKEGGMVPLRTALPELDGILTQLSEENREKEYAYI